MLGSCCTPADSWEDREAAQGKTTRPPHPPAKGTLRQRQEAQQQHTHCAREAHLLIREMGKILPALLPPRLP